MVEGLLPGLQGQKIRHLAVHARGPQGPPEGDDQGPPVVHPQDPLSLRFRQWKEVPPHRSSGDHHLLRAAVVLPAGLEAHHDPVRVSLQHLGRQAGYGVGLVDSGGNPHLGGGFHQRIAGIAPGTHHRVGPEGPENGPGLPRSPYEVAHGDEVVLDLRGLERAVEAGDMDGLEVIARLGHQVLFQSPLRADEQNLRLGVLFQGQLRQGNRGIHMPRRPSAGKNDPLHRSWHSKLLPSNNACGGVPAPRRSAANRLGPCVLGPRASPQAGGKTGREAKASPLLFIRPWWASSVSTPTARPPSPPAG